jgi:pyroglutamyl-peptidase
MKPKILVAGFGPFPGAASNPSGRLALDIARSRRLADKVTVAAAVIPTVYDDVFSSLSQLLACEKPDAVLLFGLAGSTPWMRIETRAANFAMGIHPDAAGRKTKEQSLIAGAPSRLTVRAPVRRLFGAARQWNSRAKLSIDAGGYICNAALFHCLDAARRTGAPKLVAFIHIPWPRGRARKRLTPKNRPPTFDTLLRAAESIVLSAVAALRG